MINQQPMFEQTAPIYESWAMAAAILGANDDTWDAELLAALTGEADAADLLVEADLACMTINGQYRLSSDAAAQAQATLDADPQRERELHAAAADCYASRCGAQAENAYMHHLARQCEMLIHQQPATLADVANAVDLQRLAQPAHRHLVHYYRALGAGLREEIGGAREQFAALLAKDDLDDTVRGRALNSSAIFARQQGDYEQALAGYRACQEIWQRLGNQGREGLSLLNQGILHYELQEYSAAENDLLAALELLSAAGMAVYAGSAHNELGLVYRDEGRWNEARHHLDTCMTIWREEGATEYLGFAAINLGEMALLQGGYAEAKERFQSALELLGDDQPYAVEAYINLGLLAQAQGEHGAALEAYERAQTLATQVGYNEREALINLRLGHAHERVGAPDAAAACYAAAVEAVEARRAPMRNEGLLISLMGRWQQVYEARILLALAQNDIATAFATSERARARAFADMLARRADTASHDGTHTAQIVDPSSFAIRPSSVFLSYFAIGLRGPEQALLDRLPPEAAGLRECFQVPTRLLCFALTSAGPRVHVCAIDPNLLHSSSPRRADGRRFVQPAILRQLYDVLLGPVADLLTPDISLTIAPHGPLHQIPFAALVSANEKPLIDQVQRLSYTPSATVWQRAQEKQHEATWNKQTLLAVGFNGDERGLRHTEAEAHEVAAHHNGTAWIGESGVLERFVAHAGEYRWLHLACHGSFDLNEPLRSALHIGPHEQLSAATVIERVQLNADLVTLSACRSGVSKVLRGDEPLGLVRAFLGAGARAVLVTLWPVEDTSARLLMDAFYNELLAHGESHDPAHALLAAQQSLRSVAKADLSAKAQEWGLAVPEALNCADPSIWAAYSIIEG